jgi:hypothetical protein
VIDVGRESVADIEGLRSASRSIGTVHRLPAFLDLPSLISRFHGTNSGIEVRLRQGDSAGLMRQLRAGQLDLAFLPLLDPPDDIVTRKAAKCIASDSVIVSGEQKAIASPMLREITPEKATGLQIEAGAGLIRRPLHI